MQSLTGTGRPIDTVSLMDALTQSGDLDAAGGLSYISQLADGLPRLTNVEHYAKIVRLKAKQRELIHFCAKTQERAWDDGESFETVADDAIAGLLGIIGNHPTAGKSRK